MKKIMFFRRFTIMLLFIGAFYTTVVSISNINILDVERWLQGDSSVLSQNVKENIRNREIALKSKSLDVHKENKGINTSVVENKTLEDVIDLDQYPSETVIATGYTAGIESTGKTPDHPEYGITYSGIDVKRDLYSTIAADITVFPLGTILYVPDYGYGVVADIGGAIKGNKIDLYYETVEDVYEQWGKKEVDVYVIKVGDGRVTEDELIELNENKSLQVFRKQITSE